jgi:electron transport complex protein RnfD
MKALPTVGAHIRDGGHVAGIMRQVLLALSPATAFGIVIFGWPALFLFVVTVASAVAFEALCLSLKGVAVRPVIADGSAMLTGWLVAMTLPPWAPWWIGVVGAGIAIVLGKQVYGGLGQNLFNPAMLARVALLISFPVEMTTWTNVVPLFSAHAPGVLNSLQITFGAAGNVDAVSGATTLGLVKTEFTQNHVLPDILRDYSGWLDFIGWTRGSMGETSGLLLLLGGLWLIYRRIITWHIPFALIAAVGVPAGIMHASDPAHYLGPGVYLNSGALLCTAFFFATDYVTSPNTPAGQLLFGVGCGLLMYVIRTWGAYPEGAAFSVLLMNAATPLIDYYIRPRIYGRYRNGKPIEISKS